MDINHVKIVSRKAKIKFHKTLRKILKAFIKIYQRAIIADTF